MILENLNRVVFAGDSITDMQRAYPIGEGLNDRAGFGYVRMIDNLLAAWYPEICVRVTNAGICAHAMSRTFWHSCRIMFPYVSASTTSGGSLTVPPCWITRSARRPMRII